MKPQHVLAVICLLAPAASMAGTFNSSDGGGTGRAIDPASSASQRALPEATQQRDSAPAELRNETVTPGTSAGLSSPNRTPRRDMQRRSDRLSNEIEQRRSQMGDDH